MAYPAVDPATIIANLEPAALYGLHQVQILAALHATQHNVTDL
jgi:hypothetical protein